MSSAAELKNPGANSHEARLAALNLQLPTLAAPAAAYVPYTISGKQVIVSGQLPFVDGKIAVAGKLGDGVTMEQAKHAAEVCAKNILAHLKTATGGNLDKIAKVLKLEILVAAHPSFSEPHVVANGASELMLAVFGDAGKHARVAYGVATLPFNAAVEVAALVELA